MEEHEDSLLICRCEEVLRQDILRAIEEGATTVDQVKRRTRAGMGLCQGKTCGRLVRQILAERAGQPMAQTTPSTHRPPVRPVELGVLASGDESQPL